MRKLVKKVKNKIVGKPTGNVYHNEKAEKYEKKRQKQKCGRRSKTI